MVAMIAFNVMQLQCRVIRISIIQCVLQCRKPSFRSNLSWTLVLSSFYLWWQDRERQFSYHWHLQLRVRIARCYTAQNTRTRTHTDCVLNSFLFLSAYLLVVWFLIAISYPAGYYRLIPRNKTCYFQIPLFVCAWPLQIRSFGSSFTRYHDVRTYAPSANAASHANTFTVRTARPTSHHFNEQELLKANENKNKIPKLFLRISSEASISTSSHIRKKFQICLQHQCPTKTAHLDYCFLPSKDSK